MISTTTNLTLSVRLQIALAALLGHCEQELLAKGQLSRDEEQKLRRLIWQIKQVLHER